MTDLKYSKTNFCIVGTQRTGTTFLRTSLDSHPRVHCAGELLLGAPWPVGILQQQKRLFKGGYWQHARSSYVNSIDAILRREYSIEKYLDRFYETSEGAAVGFKAMLNQLRDHPSTLDYFKRHRIKIVHLTRNNVLATLISRTRAKSTGTYHISKNASLPTREEGRIYLDEADLLSRLQKISDENKAVCSLFEGYQHYFNICYEDFCNADSSSRDSIFRFLNVEAVPLNSHLQKIVSGTLDTIIMNSDVVYSIVRNSDFAYCLDSFH